MRTTCQNFKGLACVLALFSWCRDELWAWLSGEAAGIDYQTLRSRMRAGEFFSPALGCVRAPAMSEELSVRGIWDLPSVTR
jgi:hypothetical protein